MISSASPVPGFMQDWHGRYEEACCPLCGPGASSRPVLRAHDWSYRRAEEFVLRKCEGCELVYVSPRPRVQFLGDYYPDDYPAHLAPPPRAHRPAQHWRTQLRQAALAVSLGYPPPSRRRWLMGPARLLRRWVENAGYPPWSPRPTLIDVGCGRGDFLFAMQSLGWNVCGLDLSPRAVRATRQNGIPVRQERLVTLDWPDSSVDVITFQDSFEHHPDPIETLTAAARLLRPDGALLIRFPNFNAPWRPLFGPYWADVSVPRHLYHFTPRTLRRLVEQCGFQVQSIRVLRSAEFSRSLNVRDCARAGREVPLRRWACLLDHVVSFGHCLLRARRR